MKKNILLPKLISYFKEMMSLEGKAFVLNSFATTFKNEFKKRPENQVVRDLMTSISSFRDLSKMEEGDNLYNTGFKYNVSTLSVDQELDIILSKEYCLIISQCYEILESYLNNLFTDLIYHKRIVAKSIPKLKDITFPITKKKLKQLLKETVGRPKNNRAYINAIRRLSPHFVKHETKNIYKLNLGVWFDLLGEVRHNVIHNRQVVSDKLKLYLKDKQRLKVFKIYFQIKNTYDGRVIFMTHSQFTESVHLCKEFAYFIFKALSIDNNWNPVYPLHQEGYDFLDIQ